METKKTGSNVVRPRGLRAEVGEYLMVMHDGKWMKVKDVDEMERLEMGWEERKGK